MKFSYTSRKWIEAEIYLHILGILWTLIGNPSENLIWYFSLDIFATALTQRLYGLRKIPGGTGMSTIVESLESEIGLLSLVLTREDLKSVKGVNFSKSPILRPGRK